jgi:hypothetical protein
VDKGWVLNRDAARWELLGSDGETVHGMVSLDFLARCGPASANRAGVRHGWPELVPGAPWIHVILAGGPLDGLHQYLDPAVFDFPPAELTFSGQVLVSARPGARFGIHPSALAAAYRKSPQLCGHGRDCPYPYRAAT